METRHFIKTLCKQKVKTFFLNTLIALKWVPRLSNPNVIPQNGAAQKKNVYLKIRGPKQTNKQEITLIRESKISV